MKKITSFLMVLFVALGAMAQTEIETEAVVKMTYVDGSDVSTAMGEIAAGETARAGYNKISGGSVALANSGWGCNWITYIQVDASSITGNIIGATLTVEVSGSTDGKRTTGWGLGYNSSVWSADMTYESADKTITTFGDMQWTSTNSATTFETKTFDIYDVIKNDDDKVVTLLVYETAAAGGYIKNPKAIIKTGANVPVTSISLDKSTAEITEGMVMNLLTATVAPDNATDKTVTWTSSDESIATVKDGQVIGVAVGTATITAEASGFKATCDVTVIEKNPKTSWDFAALYKVYGNKAGMTHAVNTIKIGGVDCNYGIGEYEGLAAQDASKWFLYSDGGLYNGNGGHRSIGVLNLKEGQIVTVVANTETELALADANTANQLSVKTVDGKSTYQYGMIADGALVLKMTRYYTLISIKVEDARELVITDGNDFAPEYDAYSSATYTRTLEAGKYGTICLPFAPDEASLENYTFFKMESVGADAINFVEETAPKANTPYIYCLKGENVAITGGATVVSADINSVEVGNWTMKGSFTKQTIATAGADTKYYGYVADQNKIVKANKTLTVLPYRAYFTAPVNATAVALRITRGDETTEITTADLDVQPATVIYDLAGRRVEKMEKGIYIVNGKKVIR